MPHDFLPDEDLLAGTPMDADLFGVFYRRHEDAVLGYMLRRAGGAELAADLTAEVFAAALLSVREFRSDRGAGVAWLLGIARNVLARSLERRRVEDRARRRLGMAPIELTPDALEAVAALEADARVAALLATLPGAEAAAVQARVVDGTSYVEIAADLRCSQQVVRQRVSRGLARLRGSSGVPT